MDYLGRLRAVEIRLFWVKITRRSDRPLPPRTQATNKNDRKQILHDGLLWGRLEYMASGWLAESPHKVHRKYWIDGFLPQAIINTKTGIVVTGYVWMARGCEWQGKWEYFANLPQRLVHKRNRPYEIESLWIDEEKETLDIRLVVGPGNSE